VFTLWALKRPLGLRRGAGPLAAVTAIERDRIAMAETVGVFGRR
jgi:hypothetical protein